MSPVTTLSFMSFGRSANYTFGGNPMIVKLADRPKDMNDKVVTGDIDAVFDFVGQQVHDVVPGAYIALKAGAHMSYLDGSVVNVGTLGAWMNEPTQRVKYVIS